MPHDPTKAEYWHGHVQAWRASGLSQRAYCRQHDINPHRLSYWSRRPTQPEPGLTLIPLDVRPAASPMTLVGADWRLEFNQTPPAEWLAQLLGRRP